MNIYEMEDTETTIINLILNLSTLTNSNNKY